MFPVVRFLDCYSHEASETKDEDVVRFQDDLIEEMLMKHYYEVASEHLEGNETDHFFWEISLVSATWVSISSLNDDLCGHDDHCQIHVHLRLLHSLLLIPVHLTVNFVVEVNSVVVPTERSLRRRHVITSPHFS